MNQHPREDKTFESKLKGLKQFCIGYHPRNYKLVLHNPWGEKLTVSPIIRELIRRFEALQIYIHPKILARTFCPDCRMDGLKEVKFVDCYGRICGRVMRCKECGAIFGKMKI